MASGGRAVQMIQPPNGSFCGAPSRVTRARPAPDGAMARREMPWVVGLAARLEVRRKRPAPGTAVSTSSSRSCVARTWGSIRTTEKAASPGAGGSWAARTMTGSTTGGGAAAMVAPSGFRGVLRAPEVDDAVDGGFVADQVGDHPHLGADHS